MSSDVVKQELLAKLKQEHCFWSYNENSIKDIPDDMLIEKTLLYLDLEEINQLFLIYPFKKMPSPSYVLVIKALHIIFRYTRKFVGKPYKIVFAHENYFIIRKHILFC